MKKSFLMLVVVIAALIGQAQGPVSWEFSATKTADKTYEVHLIATVQNGWHVFSQTQPGDAVAQPTEIKFNANPLLAVNGKTSEKGKLEKFHDQKLGISANQYAEKVDFVQIVKLKAKAKTNVAGTVEFQTCNDKICLPPKKVNFSIAII